MLSHSENSCMEDGIAGQAPSPQRTEKAGRWGNYPTNSNTPPAAMATPPALTNRAVIPWRATSAIPIPAPCNIAVASMKPKLNHNALDSTAISAPWA